jgi:uncharacterized membrane protein
MLVTYPFATVMLGAPAAAGDGPVLPGALLWGSLYGITQVVGVYWFYAALAAGPISVVSPLAAVLEAAVPVVVGFAIGERPGQIASAGRGAGDGLVAAGTRGCPDSTPWGTLDAARTPAIAVSAF